MDVVWTPITPVNGTYTVNEQLQPNYAIIVRRELPDNYSLLNVYFNGTSTVHSINYNRETPIFISQQVLYTDGTRFSGSLNYTSKYPNRSISEEYHNGAAVSNWITKIYAKFE